MKIINGSERFKWNKEHWINDGYGEFKSLKNKSSPGMHYGSKDAKVIAAVGVVDEVIEKMIKAN